MPAVIETLRADHVNMARLLHLVETEIGAFKAGTVPDYALLGDILDYLLNYPDLCHHPLENTIYRRLRRRVPAEADAVRELEDEHGKIAELTRRFAAAVHNVAAESQIPREAFIDLGNEFLDLMRRHMIAEETRFFPLALDNLGPSDWAEIEDKLARHADPLFKGAVLAPYRALHARLLGTVLRP